MAKPRRPKDLDRFYTPDITARWLEGLAAYIRTSAEAGTVIRLSVDLKFWNDAWLESKIQTAPTRTRNSG